MTVTDTVQLRFQKPVEPIEQGKPIKRSFHIQLEFSLPLFNGVRVQRMTKGLPLHDNLYFELFLVEIMQLGAIGYKSIGSKTYRLGDVTGASRDANGEAFFYKHGGKKGNKFRMRTDYIFHHTGTYMVAMKAYLAAQDDADHILAEEFSTFKVIEARRLWKVMGLLWTTPSPTRMTKPRQTENTREISITRQQKRRLR